MGCGSPLHCSLLQSPCAKSVTADHTSLVPMGRVLWMEKQSDQVALPWCHHLWLLELHRPWFFPSFRKFLKDSHSQNFILRSKTVSASPLSHSFHSILTCNEGLLYIINYQIKTEWQPTFDLAAFYSHDGSHFTYTLWVADTPILMPPLIGVGEVIFKKPPANPKELSLQNIEKNETILLVIKRETKLQCRSQAIAKAIAKTNRNHALCNSWADTFHYRMLIIILQRKINLNFMTSRWLQLGARCLS